MPTQTRDFQTVPDKKGQTMAIYGKTSKATIQRGIDNLEPFKVASMSGQYNSDISYGILPEPYRHQLTVLNTAEQVVYVVYSYKTPIAWRTTGGTWVIPDIKYSRTTSVHQGIVRVCVNNPGFYNMR